MKSRRSPLSWTMVGVLVAMAWGATVTHGVPLAHDVSSRQHWLQSWHGGALGPFVVVAKVETTQGGKGWALSLWVPTWCREVGIHWTDPGPLCGYPIF